MSRPPQLPGHLLRSLLHPLLLLVLLGALVTAGTLTLLRSSPAQAEGWCFVKTERVRIVTPQDGCPRVLPGAVRPGAFRR